MRQEKKGLRGISLLLAVIIAVGGFVNPFPAKAEDVGSSKLVTDFRVEPLEVSHTGNIKVSIAFEGQGRDPAGEKYIEPGTRIEIPVWSGDGARLEKAGNFPQDDKARITYTGDRIIIEFTEEVRALDDIKGNFYFTMTAINEEQGSEKHLTIGDKSVTVTNPQGGDTGVFAYKTGDMDPNNKPGYVSWYLVANVNADADPGGPTVFKDKLGQNQKLDGSGIAIDMYWGKPETNPHHIQFKSIEEFLRVYPMCRIDYRQEAGEIEVMIPGEVLGGVYFSFAYDALILDQDAKEFQNAADIDFYEHGKPGHRYDDKVVDNIDMGGSVSGTTRAYLNINKVAGEKEFPVPDVTFRITRKDGGKLYQDKEDRAIELTTDKGGQIRARGFRPGILELREINGPAYVSFNPQDVQEIELFAKNKEEVHKIANEVRKTKVSVNKEWVGAPKESVTVKLLADKVEKASAILTADKDWKHTFDELDMYDPATGREIEYRVEEAEIAGYKSVIKVNSKNNFTITNTIEGRVSIPVTKEWVGPEGASATINLLADGKKVDSVVLDKDKDWKHTFKDQAKYDPEDGHQIIYDIEEVKLDGYSSSKSGDAVHGFTITNTIEGKVSIPVTKKWIGKEGKEIKVFLLADGKQVESKVITKNDKWQYTFKGKDKFRRGKEILYSVQEEKVKGYETRITPKSDGSYLITNKEKVTKSEAPKKGKNFKGSEKGRKGIIGPKTGDNSPVYLWGLLLAFAAFAGLLLVIIKRNRK